MSIEEALQAVDEELAERGYRSQRMTDFPHPSWALTRANVQLKPLEPTRAEESTEDLLQGHADVLGVIELGRKTRLLNEDCQYRLAKLQEIFPSVRGAMVVERSHVDQPHRRQRLGRLLYEQALLESAKRGYAMAPDVCDGGSTSVPARGVWRKLKERYPHRGSVVVGRWDEKGVP